MKENTENNNRRLKVYWGVREWLHSMYPTYLKWLILPLILIMLIGLDKQTDETIVNTITSVYAGILSSVIVTALVQKRQDKLSLDKKKAILFDATFLLNDFSKKYLALEDKGKDNWIEVYNTCEDAASYLANLYSNHTDVFDIMELDYLRAINSSLFFINKLRNVNSSKLKDSDELTIKVWGEYSKQVNKLIDNLHDLIHTSFENMEQFFQAFFFYICGINITCQDTEKFFYFFL